MTKRNTFFAGMIAVALLAIVLVVSSTRDAAPATPTPSSTASAQPSGTPAPLLPQVPNGEPLPPAVAKIVVAMTNHQTEGLDALLAYQQVACTTAQGTGGPPKCKAGDTAGKVYRVFATGACEAEWTDDAGPVLKQVVTTSGPLYAVVKLTPPTPDPDPSRPKGTAAVIFNAGSGGGGYFVVAGEQIVRVHTYCGTPAIETLLKSLGATAFYVAPAAR